MKTLGKSMNTKKNRLKLWKNRWTVQMAHFSSKIQQSTGFLLQNVANSKEKCPRLKNKKTYKNLHPIPALSDTVQQQSCRANCSIVLTNDLGMRWFCSTHAIVFRGTISLVQCQDGACAVPRWFSYVHLFWWNAMTFVEFVENRVRVTKIIQNMVSQFQKKIIGNPCAKATRVCPPMSCQNWKSSCLNCGVSHRDILTWNPKKIWRMISWYIFRFSEYGIIWATRS